MQISDSDEREEAVILDFEGMRDGHKRFVAEYLIDSNATKAAMRAGYSASRAPQTGSDLLRRADVRAAIDEAFRLKSARAMVDAETVIAGLLNIAVNVTLPAAARVRAYELIGRQVGMFRQGVDVTMIHRLAAANGLSDDEVAEAIKEAERLATTHS